MNLNTWSNATIGSEGTYGGLVEENDGLIVQSCENGQVNGGGSHGSGSALAAYNAGTIRQSYATGAVATISIGGSLVGSNDSKGVIEESFATGAAGLGGSFDTFGGIAASNAGTIRNNVYWDKQTTVHDNAVASP